MKITFDEDADAVYISLDPESRVARTVPIDPVDLQGMANLDLDDDGRIVGIEILGATGKLPRSFLASLEP